MFSWTPESSIEAHITRVKDKLMDGLRLVEELSHSPPHTMDVPGITSHRFYSGASLPLSSDKYAIVGSSPVVFY